VNKRQSDLFVLTSLHEGFGIVFMESMYCGLPIVCTNNGGQVDFLTNEENALLINVGDVEGCARSIQRFHDDGALYEYCAKNNRKRVQDFYAESVAEKYMEKYTKIIPDRGR
jgi:glycosyltransferase involved in cell wall biosynthesis